jgi:hypothetical protein
MRDEMSDLELMQNPLDWPRWPFLPVKERIDDQIRRTGVLVERTRDVVEPKIYVGNIVRGINFQTAEIVEFSDFQSIIDAGWVVD